MTLQIGSLVGEHYRILRQIGRGGMGVVYEVENSRTQGGKLALKTAGNEGFPSPEGIERLRREAHVGAILRHRSIARTFDFQERGPTPYLVMELLQGRSLSELLSREQRFSAAEAVSLLAPVLEGLQKIDDAGIVHRDIKPSNLFLVDEQDEPPHLKIIDFGIAYVNENGASGVLQTPSLPLTEKGTFLGTWEYAAPEQANQHGVDGRSDVFAVGSVLFEMIKGRLPYEATTPVERLFSIAQERKVDLEARMEREVPGMGATLARALTGTPENRFANASSFKAALLASLDNGAHSTVRSIEEQTTHKVVPEPARRGAGFVTPSTRPIVQPPEKSLLSKASGWAWPALALAATLTLLVVLVTRREPSRDALTSPQQTSAPLTPADRAPEGPIEPPEIRLNNPAIPPAAKRSGASLKDSAGPTSENRKSQQVVLRSHGSAKPETQSSRSPQRNVWPGRDLPINPHLLRSTKPSPDPLDKPKKLPVRPTPHRGGNESIEI